MTGDSGGKQEWLLVGMRFIFGGDKNVPKLIAVMVAQVCEYTKMIE